jgi:hypothetical protein
MDRRGAIGGHRVTLPKRITYDLLDGGFMCVEAGDVLRSARGRCWLVVSSRRVRSKIAPSRWALEVVNVEEPAPGPDLRVFSFRWNPRGLSRRTR